MEIRPSSDLRNNYTEVSSLVKTLDEPVFLTKNGVGDMVVMSMETYRKREEKNKIHDTLLERELDLQANGVTYDLSDSVGRIVERLKGKANASI